MGRIQNRKRAIRVEKIKKNTNDLDAIALEIYQKVILQRLNIRNLLCIWRYIYISLTVKNYTQKRGNDKTIKTFRPRKSIESEAK